MERPYNVLFLCTGNSARSILAEATLNAMAHGRARAYSAGSHPTGRVNPLVLDFLRERHIPVDEARSKSWDEYASPAAPKMDLVITVCDSAAGEACPIWPGRPALAHWGLPDPAAHMDDPAKARAVIAEVHRVLKERIGKLLDLPFETLDRVAVQARARELGRAA